jgi:hypothetical protein
VKGLFGKDLITYVTGKYASVANIIFVLVGVAALAVAFHRDTYLPFLGPSVVPCSLLKEQTPENANVEVKIITNPGAKVLYWAAEPANNDFKELLDWRKAYLGFRNAGVTLAGPDGVATLRVRKPEVYKVPVVGELAAHIHYRVCGDSGMIGRVETVSTNMTKEAFANEVRRQESNKPVDGPEAFVYVNPASALQLINTATMSTLQHSLMTQNGALVEGPVPAGTPLDAAYAPGQIKVELL